ncbi:MAG: MotE family protein [Vulcanibacillus sp.]
MSQGVEKSYSKLEWILYIIILPILFISILTVVVLWFLDYDVKGKIFSVLNKVPVIEKLIDDDYYADKDNTNINLNIDDLQFQLENMKETLNVSNQTIESFESTVTKKDDEINELYLRIAELEKQISEKNLSEITREQEIAELGKVYANMNPQNAAKIISYLETEEAALILKSMNIEAKSNILEKMDVEEAAKISILLKDLDYSKDQDIRALQERIKILVSENDKLSQAN